MAKPPKPTVLDESELGLSPDEVAALLIVEDEFEQGSEEWHEQRNGKATASMFKVIVARDRYGKPYKGYYDYMRLTPWRCMSQFAPRLTCASAALSNTQRWPPAPQLTA
jgi:hypothetical protein